MYRNVGIYEKTYLFLVNDINYGNQLASIWTKRNVDDSSNLHEPCVCLQHNHIFPYVQAQPLLSAKIKITRDPEKFITETRSSAIAERLCNAGSTLPVASKLKLHGVTTDANLRFDCHTRNVAQACNYHTPQSECSLEEQQST